MKELFKRPFFTSKEANDAGCSNRMLSYYVENGTLERISRGVYRGSDYEDVVDSKWLGLATSAKSIKNGVICLLSALIYYELTDEFMSEYWIAIPHKQSKSSMPSTKIVRMRNVELGISSIKLCEMDVKIFDVERTIIDSFRLLDLETSMKALKSYMSGACGKPNIKKLTKYSKELRQDISKYILPFTI